jgi:hypothetical protein
LTKDYSRALNLLCPTCAGSEFEFDIEIEKEMRIYQCIGCDRSFDHDQLMHSNSSRIEAEVSAIGQELIGDTVKMLRKGLSGNKLFKLK